MLFGIGREQTMQFAELKEQVGSIAERVTRSDPLHDKEAHGELTRIRRSRGIPGLDAKNEIFRLISRIEEGGDLTFVPKRTLGEVYAWAARIYAYDEKKIKQARFYLSLANEKLGSNDDVLIAEAWISAHSGGIEEALRILNDLDSPDARTSIMSILSHKREKAAALQWFQEAYRGNPDILSPVGWRSLAILLAEDGKWDDSVKFLSGLPGKYFDEYPDLLYVRAVLHAGYLLPESIRPQVLGLRYVDAQIPIQEGREAEYNRIQATQLFQKARELMIQVGALHRAEACDYWLMWLRMTDSSQKGAAVEELKSIMETAGERSSFYADIAFAFNVPFNQTEFERHLRIRSLEGGLTPKDYLNKLTLLKRQGKPQQVLAFLEEEDLQLRQVLTETSLIQNRILALIEDSQYDEAENELKQHEVTFSPEDVSRFSLIITERRGGDPFAELQALYTRTGAYEDLLNLVNYLVSKERWGALTPFARDLLSKEHKAKNLSLLIQCMELSNVSSEEILSLIEMYDDLGTFNTDTGMTVLSRKVWTLFRLGRFDEARTLNDQLIQKRKSFQDIGLELNIALLSGQWEHFSAVLDREYPNRENLPPDLLVHMASLTSDDVPDRTMELLRIAAEKAPDDGIIQATCYQLAVHLGREFDAAPWFRRAVELSREGKGPLQQVTLRKFAEMVPDYSRTRQQNTRMFMEGDIPLHLAAGVLNFSLAGLLVGQARRNAAEKDPRQRSIIPIRHGARPVIKFEERSRLASDISSLLILEDLGLLGSLLEAVEFLFISPNLMELLFREQRQVRFHQPSLVADARKLLKLVGDGVIAALEFEGPISQPLTAEVGEGMAMLLEAAHRNNGCVIAALPILKVGSFGEEAADLGDLSALVLKTTQFTDALFEEGFIDESTRDTANSFLSQVDRGLATVAEGLGVSYIFVDDVALHYLIKADIINYLPRLGRRIFVAPSAVEQAKTILEVDEHGSDVAEIIDRLRRRLAKSLSERKVQTVPEAAADEIVSWEKEVNTRVFLDLIGVAGNVDAICIDDRMIGRHAQASGKHGSSPVIGATDVIALLLSQNLITTNQYKNLFLRMYERGYVFLPLNLEEIYSNLLERYSPQSKRVRENAYLRAIRENVQRVRSLTLLRSDEFHWLEALGLIFRHIMVRVWKDENLEVDQAIAISDWMLISLSPSPDEWRESVIGGDFDFHDAVSKFLSTILLWSPFETSLARRQMYGSWLERRFIQPFLPANPEVLDSSAANVADRLLMSLMRNVGDENS